MNERELKEHEASMRRLENMGKYLCPKCGHHGKAKTQRSKGFRAAFYASIVVPIFSWLLPYLSEGDEVCAKCGAKLSSDDYSAGMNYTP